jgi:hypothetical protein
VESSPRSALPHEAPPPIVAAAEMTAAIQTHSTVAMTLPDTAGIDRTATPTTTPARSPTATTRTAEIRALPDSASWVAPAGRATSGRMTVAPIAAANVSATRSPKVGTWCSRLARQPPASAPATTDTMARKANHASWPCQGAPVAKGRSHRTMPSPYTTPS